MWDNYGYSKTLVVDTDGSKEFFDGSEKPWNSKWSYLENQIYIFQFFVLSEFWIIPNKCVQVWICTYVVYTYF